MAFPKTTDYIINNQELMLEWDWDKNNKIGLDPNTLTHGSHKKAWWKCNLGHSYNTPIYNKTSSTRPTKCPVCNGKQILYGFNDLKTLNPMLAQEWHPIKNGNLAPEMVTEYSNKKVWWQCEFGHEWEATIADRSNGRCCPICSKEMRTSFPEQAILFYFNKITIAYNRYTAFGKEIDIYLPEYKIGIEYNGKYWHKNKIERDTKKVAYFSNQGIRIISVYESDTDIVSSNVIYYIYGKTLDWCIENIFKLIGISNNNVIDTRRDRFEIYHQYITSRKENSFGENYPQLAEEWFAEKNGNLTPYMVSKCSNKVVWWKCKKCGYEWEASVNSRSNGSGCKKCGHERRKCLWYIMIYCQELKQIFDSEMCAAKQLGILYSSISMCLRKRQKSAGRHPITKEKLHWYYVYDQLQKDGTTIPGAISLGYITQEDVERQLNNVKLI